MRHVFVKTMTWNGCSRKETFFQKILYNRLRKSNRSYLYPVLYSDGIISNAICDRIGRKPLGIIFENHLITLRDSSKRMKWDEAMDYCKSIKIFGQSCEAGTIEFWKKCIGKKKSKAINKMLASLGGKRIKPERHWSSSKLSSYGAWCFWTGNGDGYNSVELDYKDRHIIVRPVLDFSKLPPEVVARFVWLT